VPPPCTVPTPRPTSLAAAALLHTGRVHEPAPRRSRAWLPPRAIRPPGAVELPRGRTGARSPWGGRRLMAAGTMRDISSGPVAESPPGQPRRPRRDEPYEPASSTRPLLLAHGGALTVDRLGTVPYE